MSEPKAFGLEDFGVNLRRIRGERKMTQEKLAEGAQVSSRYVSLLECGKRNPSLQVVLDLARGLGVPPARLFK